MSKNDRHTAANNEAVAARLEVVRLPGTGLRSSADLQILLHKRLRFFATFLVAAMANLIWLTLTTPRFTWFWYFFAGYAFVFADSVALAGVLWTNSSLSLRRLRLIELLLFGTVIAFWTFLHTVLYPYLRLDDPPGWFGSVMANAICLPWVFIIFVYGIFIPNTWRRCAAVVSTAAVIPFVVSFATGLSADVTRGDGGGAIFWVSLVVWMGSAAAIAIYGAHRIEVLRVEAATGRQLGQYRLKQRLGSGGMGEVYLAEHVLLRRPCAVKLIRPDRATDSTSFVRFEREVQATATLTSPNTVQVFDYGHTEDGTFYYAMEYLPGLNLDELVKRHGPLPPERLVHLLRQVCGALHEAHATGLIHRDIKPSNIIICQRGGLHDIAKLLDFGLVRTYAAAGDADHLTQQGAITGTPAYMSPEQADGKQDLDARSDIYSLGAVAYFLLTGQPPFLRPTALQTLIAHLSDRPVPPDQLRTDLPGDLQAMVMRCLEKDPAGRFPDARSLEAALVGCQASGTWTEEWAASWWHVHSSSTDAANSAAEATTRVA